MLKCILRYLKNTKNYDLLINGLLDDAKFLLNYKINKIWNGKQSTTRIVFTFCGGCISWRSIIKKFILKSTAEIEYIAAKEAASKLFIEYISIHWLKIL